MISQGIRGQPKAGRGQLRNHKAGKIMIIHNVLALPKELPYPTILMSLIEN